MKKKKGFTLVELLVVIAILAILASVSVVGYLSFTKKAQESNDISLTTQMNTILQGESVIEGVNKTPYDAVLDLMDSGLDVTKLTPTRDGNEFVYDLSQDRFFLINGEKVVAPSEGNKISVEKADVFKFVGKNETLSDVYSNYLKNDYVSTGVETISTGLDVGSNTTITTINYTNETKKIVTIRTNGGALTVNGPQDTIHHYGNASIINVKSVDLHNSYHEFGNVESINVTKGRVVAEENSKISEIMVTRDAIAGNVKIDSIDKNSIQSIVVCTDSLLPDAISGTNIKPIVGKIVTTKEELDSALWPVSGQPASYVILNNNIDMTGLTLAVKDNLILNGNGFTLKGKRISNKNELKNESTIYLGTETNKEYNVTIKNITIENTSNSEKACNIAATHFVRSLSLSNVKLVNKAPNGYGVRFGGESNYSSPELDLNLSDVTISMHKSGYGIGIERKTIGNIENTEINGYASLLINQ